MKILHTNFHRGWGGQSNRILTVCDGLTKRGHEVVLAVPRDSKLHRRAEERGVEVFTEVEFRRGFRPIPIAGDLKNLARLQRERQFDIIHTHGSQDTWTIAYLSFFLRRKPVILRTKHNVFPIVDHAFNRWLYGKLVDYHVVISGAIQEYCANKSYLEEKNLFLIPSAVEAENFAKGDGAKLREEYGLNDDHLVVGITGRLREEKGHRYLLDAWAEFSRETPEARLLVVGDGSLGGEFKQQVKQLGTEDSVIFTGFRKDVPDVLASLDLFVMPSISEGLGTAILEAGAARLPIIASRVGGIPDIIEDGRTGLLTEPHDPKSILEALRRLRDDRDLARKLAENARAHVETEFSPEQLVAKTERCYEEVLGKTPES